MRIALVAAILLLALPTAAQAVTARIWIAGERPLLVRGTGFHASQKVTVTAKRSTVVFRMTVTTTRTGSFRAAWKRALPAICANTSIVARDASGRRATYFVAADDCGPPVR